MKHLQTQEVFEREPGGEILKALTVRALREDEYDMAGQVLDQEHYLGDLPKGRRLLQAVEHQGSWVALLDWGPASHKLAERDEWIGWTGQQRAERLSLVAMNRRFLVMGKTRMPNLASKALSLALKALPEQWRERYGYAPVLAETFVDIEQFEGTCYKASNWMPCGMTQGFGKHRMDYYTHHGRPKKLWLKTLNRNTRVILTGMDLPKAYQAALNRQSPERDLPLKKKQIDSLRDYIRAHFKDPRKTNRIFPASSLLSLIAMGIFAGRTNLASIQRYGQFLTQQQRMWLDFPPKKKQKGRKAPCYTALRNLLVQIDPHQFAEMISGWLAANQGILPRALAIDGKWVRDKALSLCLSEHESGSPVAVAFAQEKPKSDQAKKEGELTVAKKLYEQTDLNNAVVTADALYCNKPQIKAVLKNGGDYFFQLKNENRKAFKNATATAGGSPLLNT